MKYRVCLAAVIGASMMVSASGLALASDRAFVDDGSKDRPGNWTNPDASEGAKKKKASSKKKKSKKKEASVPIPRAKPGSKAAKADEARKKKEKKEQKTAKKQDDDKSAVPIPRKKNLPASAVQAGLAVGFNADAPYRGELSSSEIKSLLSEKVLSSRVNGKAARITLAKDGSLNWSSDAGEGAGVWWTENGRVCDRYDEAGDFPGRPTGCKSFEQKEDGLYVGGQKLQVVN